MKKKQILLKLTSFNTQTLNLFFLFLKFFFIKYNIPFALTFLKKKSKKITLLKSPHVHKKAREQFQMLKFSYLISIKITELNFAELFSILKLNTPKNIDVDFTITYSK